MDEQLTRRKGARSKSKCAHLIHKAYQIGAVRGRPSCYVEPSARCTGRRCCRARSNAVDVQRRGAVVAHNCNVSSGAGSGRRRSEIEHAAEQRLVGSIAPHQYSPTTATGIAVVGNDLVARHRCGFDNQWPGAANLTISGSGANRVFFVDAPNTSLTISGLTIAQGVATGGDGGGGTIFTGGGGLGAGGAVFVNAGNLKLSNVNFSGNEAIGGNGGNTANVFGSGGGGGLGGNGGPG